MKTKLKYRLYYWLVSWVELLEAVLRITTFECFYSTIGFKLRYKLHIKINKEAIYQDLHRISPDIINVVNK